MRLNSYPYFFRLSKLAFLIVFSLIGLSTLSAQEEFAIDDFDLLSSCSGLFVDDGGSEGNQTPLRVDTITICSNSAASNESHIRLTFTQFEISGFFRVYNGPTADPAFLVNTLSAENNGTNPVIEASAGNASGCLTIVFESGNNAPGFQALISCVRACQPVIASLASSDPVVMPVDTGYIDVCIGQEIVFTGTGIYPEDGIIYEQSDATSSFEWNFDDGNTASGTQVTHAYNEPGGYTVQLRITDVNGCQNNNQISQRVRVSPRPNFALQNGIPDQLCVGDTLALTASTQFDPNPGSNLFVTTTEQSFSAGQVLADTTFLPDGSGVEYTTSLEFNNFAPGQVVGSIDDIEAICLNMEHSYAGDLDLWIECPNGQEMFMIEFGNLSGQFVGIPIDQDDLQQGVGFDYCWTPEPGLLNWDEAVDQLPVPFGTSIPAGDYRPDQPFTNLIGCPLNGEWTIHVRDNLSIDNGFIFNWGISFADNLFTDLETFTVGFEEANWQPNPDLIFYSSDSIIAVPTAAGNSRFDYTVTDMFGCAHDTTLTIEVLPFSHPDCYDCQPILDEELQVVNTVPGAEIQTELASVLNQDTLITFRSSPGVPFGRQLFPSLAGAYVDTISVNSIFPGGVTDLNYQLESICINIETPATGGIRVFIQAPDNTLLPLTVGNGGDGANYTMTCFSPSATTPIMDGMAPFTGTFLPQGNVTSLDGVPINGDWKILAWDLMNNEDLGEFLSWSITFRHQVPVTYSWEPDNGTLSCTDCPDPVITVDGVTDVYTVTATNSYGCTETGTVTINSNVTIELETSSTDVTCNGDNNGTATVVATGGTEPYTYQWNVDPGNTQTITDLGPGEYFVTVTDVNGNSEVDSVTIAEPPALVLTTEVTDLLCFGDGGGSIDLTITGGTPPYSIAWSTFSDEEDQFGLAAGDYTVTVTDSLGCMTTTTATVTEPTDLMVTGETTDVDCFGNSTGAIDITISGGTPAYSVIWNDEVTDEDRTDLAAGTYEVMVTDSNGCTNTTSYIINEPTELVVEAIDVRAVDCNSDATGAIDLTVAGGTPEYTYLWSNDAVTPNISDIPAGLYSVTITDANGCTLEINDIDVAEPNALSCTVSIVQESANGDDGILTVAVEGGTMPYVYAWNDPAGSTTETVENLSPGTYTVTVTDQNGCETVCEATLEAFSMIGDFLFFDMDRDGIQDAGEPGLGGVNVTITSQDGSFTDITTTDGSGNYEFRVMAGTYQLFFNNPGGLEASPQNQGGDDELDSDIDENTLRTDFITVGTEEVRLDIDAGFFDPCFPDLTFAGEIAADQTLCGPGNVPDALVEVASPQGGTGNLNYIWMMTTGDPTLPIISNWTPLPNSNTVNYQPGVIYETTYFARCVRQDECPYIESNIIIVEVGDDANAVIAGPNLVCESETISYQALDVSDFASVDWDVSGPATVSENADNSIDVSWSSFGAFTITLTVQDNGCTATRILNVNVSSNNDNCFNSLGNPTESLSSESLRQAAPAGLLSRVFPNPALANEVRLELLRDFTPGETVEVQLFNATGKMVASQSLSSGRQTVALESFNGMPNGLYLVRVLQGDEMETHRLIIR